MVNELGKITTLTGASGIKYKFTLWTFDEFEDIKNTFTGEGLYLFTKRYLTDKGFMHYYIYLGETDNYYTRYNNHHKEESINEYGSNCIGFYAMSNSTEEERKVAEDDLLSAYDFPCNDTYN